MGVFLMGFGRKRQWRLEMNRLTSKGKCDVKVPHLGFVPGKRGQAVEWAFLSSLLIMGCGVTEPSGQAQQRAVCLPVAKCPVAVGWDLQALWFSHCFKLTEGVWDWGSQGDPYL